MDFGANFRRLGRFDPFPLRARLPELAAEAWSDDRSAQDRYPILQPTKTLFLVHDRNRFQSEPPPREPLFGELERELTSALDPICDYFRGRGFLHRLVLRSMEGGASIPDHVVRGGRFQFVHRLQLPIVTSEAVEFQVGGERRHLAAGEIWEINNTRPHAVHHRGTQTRIHLIADWVTPDLVRGWRLHRLRAPLRALRRGLTA